MVSGCSSFRPSARSRVFLATVAGPVGGIVNVIEVSRTYRATPEQEAEALRLAEFAASEFSAKTRGKMKKNGTSLVSVSVTPAAGSKAPASVMVVDIDKKEVVSDKVFELEKEPEADEFAEFSNYFTLFTKPMTAEEAEKLKQTAEARKEKLKMVESRKTGAIPPSTEDRGED